MAKEKKKPGVMIYFKPMREQAASLNDARLAKLFRAMLAYADPDCGQEPDFHDDEVLLIAIQKISNNIRPCETSPYNFLV